MNKDLRQLARRLAERVRSDSSDAADSVHREPADSFLDEGRCQLEREKFFRDTPQVIGFAGELAQPGSFITAEVLDVPVVVTRAEDGELRAFLNACTHRGARVAEGGGMARRLNCGFHGWSFALDGSLAGRPREEAFDPRCSRDDLLPLPVSHRGGLITVGLSSRITQAGVDSALEDIEPALSAYDFGAMQTLETRRFEVAANWKIVTNLSHEAYHFKVLHRDSLAPLMSDHAVVDTLGRHSRWAFPFRGMDELLDRDESGWPETFPGVINHTLFPGTVLVANPENAQLIRVEPGRSPGRAVVYYSGVYHSADGPSESKRAAALEAYDFGGTIFENEDLPAAEQCQRALDAGLPEFLSGRNEPVVSYWHRLWSRELDA